MSDKPEPTLDALLPAEIAHKAEEIGVKKAGLDAPSTVVLAVLAGAFIALGAIFSTTVSPSYAVRTIFSGFWRQFSAQVLNWQRDVCQSVL